MAYLISLFLPKSGSGVIENRMRHPSGSVYTVDLYCDDYFFSSSMDVSLIKKSIFKTLFQGYSYL